MPRNGSGYDSDSTDYSPLFDLVFGVTMLVLLVVGLPLLLFVPYWFIMIPYFAFSYGLLYSYWKRFKQKHPKEQADEMPAG
jgi:membrane protein implicated in regulation of membrane protease activity